MTGLRFVSIEDRDGIALVRIDRPPANAMDLSMLEEGHATLERLAADPPAAVVLVGRDGYFSAGVDLKAVPTLDADGQRAMVHGINRVFAGWYSFPRPVVCAVNGHAVAGGLILALCGDHRVCSTEGRFGLTELRVGAPYPAAALEVVRTELTAPVARRLVLGAGLVDPPQALSLGLVDELHEPAAVLDRALAVAGELAALPSGTYELVKRQLRGPSIDACDRIVREQADPLLDGAWLSGETAEAARAVLRGK